VLSTIPIAVSIIGEKDVGPVAILNTRKYQDVGPFLSRKKQAWFRRTKWRQN
jgi:hypothetical protein